MTIQELGAIGEFVGAIAVLVTLIYLSLQVRQLKAGTFLEGYRGMNQLFNELSNSTLTSPELAKALAKAQKNYDDLEDWEVIMLYQYFGSFMNGLEVAWQHKKTGIVDFLDDDEIIDRQLAAFGRIAGAKEYWSEHRPFYPKEWQLIVDRNIGRST